MATINRRVLTTLAVLSLFSLCVYGSDTPSVFEFYQTLSTDNSNQVDIFQQSSILYVNNTGYAFTFGFKVYATDSVPFLNASQTEPPAYNTYSNFTQAFTLNAPTSESFASASFYTSGFNSSNSGCYVTGTYYIFQYDAVTFAAKRSMPTPQSAGLENTFIDGKNMYASLRAQNLIYVFDSESFTLNTTKNFTMPFVTKATLYDTSSRSGYFFSADGEVQVWNASSLTIYDNFNSTVGYGADYQLTSVFLDEVRQISYVGMNNGTNGPPILQMFNLQPTSNTTKRQVADSNPTLIRQIVLSETPSTWTSIYVDTIGGQAFTGLTDGNNGQFLRVDLSTHTVAETVYVATADNGRVALSYHLGIQNQSLVLYSESAVNVYQYPTTCPNDCTSSEQGWCNFGTCNCSTGWTSSDCSQIACTTDCNAASGHGQCNNGVCLCGDDWTGSNCETRRCPKDCSGTNGACQGPSTNYTCTCNFRFSGAGCEVPRVLSCPEIPGAQECTGRGGECGWCESEKRCSYGNNIGPVHGACPDWFTENPKDVGIMAFAIIYVIICSILVLINIISASVIDHRNATELVATKRLTATTIRKNWWRDERSNMGWLSFEQLQFISSYGLVTVGYSTRILSFTRYFDWTCSVIPSPNYSDLEYHPERSTARNTSSYEQYGNGNDSGIQQIWYAQMVWLGIAAAGFTIIHIIYSIIATVMRGGASKEVFFSRLIHMWMRGLNIFYFPLVSLAATHTRYGYKSIAGSIIVSIVVGLGVPAISFGVTYGKRKQSFKYEWRAKFGSFYSTYHFNSPYYQAGVFAKKAAIGLLVGFMASPSSQPRLAFGQVFGAIGVMILFIAALIVFRPYLDKTHLLLEIGSNVVNIISIGMASTNYSGPSLIGDIVFLSSQIIGSLIVLGAFIHCWLAMESVNCCGGKKDQDNENNTSELATMKM